MTLKRRHKQVAKEGEKHEPDTTGKDDVKAASEAARRDASHRAGELIARLRKL